MLCVFGLIIYFRKLFIVQFLDNARLEWEKDNFFLLFGLALVIGSIWCVYRISYRTDNAAAFGPENNDLTADYTVFWLYFAIITIYITFAGFDLEKLAKTGSQIASAAGIVGLSFTGVSGRFFGLDARFQNVLAVIVVLFVLIVVGLLFNNPPPPPPLHEPDDG
jgi:hypothetical protein